MEKISFLEQYRIKKRLKELYNIELNTNPENYIDDLLLSLIKEIYKEKVHKILDKN